jgi:hypothetical protein
MSRKIRERNELRWWAEWNTRHNLNLGASELIAAMDDVIDHLNPEVIRTDATTLRDAWEKMGEMIDKLEEGMPFDIKEALKINGIDNPSQSDVTRTGAYLKDCKLLQYKDAEPARWVKRLTYTHH